MLHSFVFCSVTKVSYSVRFYAKDRFRESVGMKVVRALKREDEGVTHAAIDMVCALMHPMHDNYDLRQEQLNKSSLLSSSKFLESLLAMWISHVVSLKSTGIIDCITCLTFEWLSLSCVREVPDKMLVCTYILTETSIVFLSFCR